MDVGRHVDGKQAVVCLIHEDQTTDDATLLQALPSQLLQHGRYAAVMAPVPSDKPRCLALHGFYLLDLT